jgi:hypothetical protein
MYKHFDTDKTIFIFIPFCFEVNCKTIYRQPLIGCSGGRVDLFQPYEQSEIGPIEDWGKIADTLLHLASVSEEQKNKAELHSYLNK